MLQPMAPVDAQRIFPGAILFQLKATHGLPLDFAIDRVRRDGLTIEWPGFIGEARKNGRWDHQTIEDMQHALADSDVGREDAHQIILRAKAWMMANPPPNTAQ